MSGTGRQLTGWDAATWRTSAGSPHLRSTVVALVLLDSEPDWERLRQRVERLTRMVPVLRQRPLRGVFGVASPRLLSSLRVIFLSATGKPYDALDI